MGGTSVINSMLYVRGHSWDYDNWANLGNTGWSWRNVLPYFKKSENMRIPEVSRKTVNDAAKILNHFIIFWRYREKLSLSLETLL